MRGRPFIAGISSLALHPIAARLETLVRATFCELGIVSGLGAVTIAYQDINTPTHLDPHSQLPSFARASDFGENKSNADSSQNRHCAKCNKTNPLCWKRRIHQGEHINWMHACVRSEGHETSILSYILGRLWVAYQRPLAAALDDVAHHSPV